MKIRNLIVTILLSIVACLPAQAADLVVGGRDFTEQLILAEITSQYLRDKGYQVDKRVGMGAGVLRKAQESGQVDLYWEYTGTSLMVYNKVAEKLSADDVYKRVKELDGERGLVWLNPSKANNTFALAMRSDDASQRKMISISDLANAVNSEEKLVIAVNSGFYARDDGLKPLQKAYGFKFPRENITRMDTGLTYSALMDGNVDVALVFATDGRIPAFNLTVLKDDKGFFPDYAITPVVREETLKQNPELSEHLNAISAVIDDARISDLNARVDVGRQSIEKVAADFLTEAGFN